METVAIGRAGDRDIIVSGSGDDTVRVCDAVTGAPIGVPLAGYKGWVHAVASAGRGTATSSCPAPRIAQY